MIVKIGAAKRELRPEELDELEYERALTATRDGARPGQIVSTLATHLGVFLDREPVPRWPDEPRYAYCRACQLLDNLEQPYSSRFDPDVIDAEVLESPRDPVASRLILELARRDVFGGRAYHAGDVPQRVLCALDQCDGFDGNCVDGVGEPAEITEAKARLEPRERVTIALTSVPPEDWPTVEGRAL